MMKSRLIVILSLLTVCTVFHALGSDTVPVYSDRYLTATVIEPGVTVLETYDKTTMYLVEGDSSALLIDTGTDCPGLAGTVAKLTDKPVTVVLTHGHFDHAGNIREFDEVYMHPADTVLDVPQLRSYTGKLVPVDDGDVFDLGGRKLQVVHTPGHTPGSISLVDYDAGIAFTGDAFGSGQLWMQIEPLVPFSTLAESCGRMIELMDSTDVGKLYVGHYPYLKRPLDIDYLMDVDICARRIDKGDTAESTLFWEDGARLLKNGSCEIVFRPEASGKNLITSPTVLLKLDDVHYGEPGEAVPPRWNRVLSYLRDKGMKANFGIIGFSLTPDRPDYLNWLRDVAAKGDIEFWNHGYHNRMSPDEVGEFEKDYQSQCRALHLTDSLASSLAGLRLQGWGRHWTDCNQYTDSALASVENLQLIFGDPAHPVHFKGVVVPFNLEIEYPFHNPVYRQFLINYLGRWRHLTSFYLQGHPNSWDDARWLEFGQIVDRLLADKARFVTITDYLEDQ